MKCSNAPHRKPWLQFCNQGPWVLASGVHYSGRCPVSPLTQHIAKLRTAPDSLLPNDNLFRSSMHYSTDQVRMQLRQRGSECHRLISSRLTFV